MLIPILYRHDVDGFVQQRICFEAKIALEEDDLTLNEMRMQLRRKHGEDEEARTIQNRIPPYIAAKQLGR